MSKEKSINYRQNTSVQQDYPFTFPEFGEIGNRNSKVSKQYLADYAKQNPHSPISFVNAENIYIYDPNIPNIPENNPKSDSSFNQEIKAKKPQDISSTALLREEKIRQLKEEFKNRKKF